MLSNILGDFYVFVISHAVSLLIALLAQSTLSTMATGVFCKSLNLLLAQSYSYYMLSAAAVYGNEL